MHTTALGACEQAAQQLRHVYAQTFSSNAPSWLAAKAPNFAALVQGSQEAAMTSVGQLTSRGGTQKGR